MILLRAFRAGTKRQQCHTDRVSFSSITLPSFLHSCLFLTHLLGSLRHPSILCTSTALPLLQTATIASVLSHSVSVLSKKCVVAIPLKARQVRPGLVPQQSILPSSQRLPPVVKPTTARESMLPRVKVRCACAGDKAYGTGASSSSLAKKSVKKPKPCDLPANTPLQAIPRDPTPQPQPQYLHPQLYYYLPSTWAQMPSPASTQQLPHLPFQMYYYPISASPALTTFRAS